MVIHLEGPCPIEDTEPLLEALLADRDRSVDIGAAGRLHTAIVQLLIAARPVVSGQPIDPFMRAHLLPLLATPDSSVAIRPEPL
jgi:hypothetical protein